MILQGACSTSKSLFRRAGVLLLPLISPISAAVALPITDQSFTPDDATTSLFAVLNDAVEFTGQTYRASITGTLAGVSLAVRYAAEPPPYPLRVAIHEVAGGFPIGSVLGATTVTAGESSINEMILFPQPVSQKAGEHYGIIVHYTGDAPPPEESRLLGQWLGTTGNPYLTGHTIVSQEGASWRASPRLRSVL